MNNPNKEDSCGGGDFSQAQLVVHQYFGSKIEMKKMFK